MLLVFLLFAFLVIIFIYFKKKLRRNLDYWKKRGVKYVNPVPILGNMLPTITKTKSISELIKIWYNEFPNERYIGIFQFNTPILLIRDPDLIKSITIKNFENFVDHVGFVPVEADPLWGKNLFASQGDRWRDLRQTLSPAFTSSKMRTMFVLMDECAKQLASHFINQDNFIKVELKDIFTRFTNDVIANIAFGIKCDSLKYPNNEFLTAGKRLADFSGLKRFKFLLYGNYPKIAKYFRIKIVEDRLGNFFKEIIDETIRVRENSGITRPDLIHLLMLSRKGKLKYEDYLNLPEAGFAAVKESEVGHHKETVNYLSNEDITAQAIIFFLGGYDTASSVMAFTAYELAVNSLVQKKLRNEIAKTKNSNITYEQLLGIKYLDMVISETLRKWPPAPWLDRKCTKDFEIESERPGEIAVKLNVGDVCWIPAYGLHMDPKYFPNPDVFDPERFNEENSEKIHSATYLPFGIGPRNCIGSRFALLETKILLYHLLLEFEFVPTEETQIPLKICRNNVQMIPEKYFHMALKHSPLYKLDIK